MRVYAIDDYVVENEPSDSSHLGDRSIDPPNGKSINSPYTRECHLISTNSS